MNGNAVNASMLWLGGLVLLSTGWLTNFANAVRKASGMG